MSVLKLAVVDGFKCVAAQDFVLHVARQRIDLPQIFFPAVSDRCRIHVCSLYFLISNARRFSGVDDAAFPEPVCL